MVGVDNLPWETGVVCWFCAAMVFVGPLQGLLVAFTPVARRRDFACALFVATLQGAYTVRIGMDSDSSSALLRALVIWFMLLLNFATLNTDMGFSKTRARKPGNIERTQRMNEFCEEVEKVADVLLAYRRFGGRDPTVTRVLYNNLPNDVSRKQGVRHAATASGPGTAEKLLVRFVDTGVGRLAVVGNLNDGEPEFAPVVASSCASVQRPTIEDNLGRTESIPIIVVKADLECTAEGFMTSDMRQIQVIQHYRQVRLRQVAQDNSESSGPVRGLWSITSSFSRWSPYRPLLEGEPNLGTKIWKPR